MSVAPAATTASIAATGCSLDDGDQRDLVGAAAGGDARGVDRGAGGAPARGEVGHAACPWARRTGAAPVARNSATTSASGSPAMLVIEPRTPRTSAPPMPCTA
jgi:hypothetical protein